MLNHIPAPASLEYVTMPTPDQLSVEAMAIHHIIDLVLRVNFPPGKPVRGDYACDLLPLLRFAEERVRRLAIDIDRLASAG